MCVIYNENLLPIKDVSRLNPRRIDASHVKLKLGSQNETIKLCQNHVILIHLNPFNLGTDFRCQIPTSEVVPRTERIKVFIMTVDP